ncbi:V-type proton ATPase 16 kDa proteolipid subunit 2 [Histomonas meleagridis]|uniref:V-type proton ATPase 16 kDa proteolipid subunit 2 n=1 Tax=Histomonas meleagridis TaxID=135588 RepID=UPI00355AB7F8|nr:V-type proton ATPase 16 kDa proteolipid subunit 2 [Histomonas meleagridis]KAH0804092.1 V-type proton ATPase 16 kDa proteolipid subunit 2 [Histomonas meleagridis]
MSSIPLDDPFCPAWTPFFGFAGICIGVVLACAGSAIGTAKCGIGLASASLINKSVIVRGLIAPIMAGIIGIYGLVFAIVVLDSIVSTGYHIAKAFAHFSGGICVGFTGLAAGLTIGISGQIGIISFAKQPGLFVGMTLVLIFGEVLGIYGMVISLVLNSKTYTCS